MQKCARNVVAKLQERKRDGWNKNSDSLNPSCNSGGEETWRFCALLKADGALTAIIKIKAQKCRQCDKRVLVSIPHSLIKENGFIYPQRNFIKRE